MECPRVCSRINQSTVAFRKSNISMAPMSGDFSLVRDLRTAKLPLFVFVVWSLGFRFGVSGLGFGVWGIGFGIRVQCSVFSV